jgi:hypothetical protein
LNARGSGNMSAMGHATTSTLASGVVNALIHSTTTTATGYGQSSTLNQVLSPVHSANSSSFSQTLSYSSAMYTFVFLFTSDFERNAWLEEINGAIYACKFTKSTFKLKNTLVSS